MELWLPRHLDDVQLVPASDRLHRQLRGVRALHVEPLLLQLQEAGTIEDGSGELDRLFTKECARLPTCN